MNGVTYSGSLMESIPQNAAALIGIVLTRSGELVTRSDCNEKWEIISTPYVYLFLDTDINITFLVDTCLKKITIYEA